MLKIEEQWQETLDSKITVLANDIYWGNEQKLSKYKKMSWNNDMVCGLNKEKEGNSQKSREQQNKSKGKHSRKKMGFSLENF